MPPRTRSAVVLAQAAGVDTAVKRQKTSRQSPKKQAVTAKAAFPSPPPTPKDVTGDSQAAAVAAHSVKPAPRSPSNSGQRTLIPPKLTFSLPEAISHLSSVDPRFALFFKHIPCRPFVHLEAIDPFRTLVTSIIGQQVSWLAARAINNRFKAFFGFDPDNKDGFPSPDVVAGEQVERLKTVGLSTRKAEYVISLAQHFVSGQLSTELLRDGTDEEVSKALIAVRGIGQWTVDMFLMFSLRRPDILAVGDLGVQKGLLKWALAAHGKLPAATPKKSATKKTPKTTPKIGNEVDTTIASPVTPTPGAIRSEIPPTPTSPIPAQTLDIPSETLPEHAPSTLLVPQPGFDAQRAAPLTTELSVETLKARLAGKKVKGGMYLTPAEMELLTEPWRPYRSLGVFYMWSVAEE